MCRHISEVNCKTLRGERQSARMSKITNDGLAQDALQL